MKTCHPLGLVVLVWLLAGPVYADTLLVANKSDATVSLIDLASGNVVATAQVGEGPHEIAVSGDGELAVVANYGTADVPGNSLSVIELSQRKTVGTIDLGKYLKPHGILFLPDSRRVLVTSETGKELLLVDVYLGKVEKVMPTGQWGSHMLAYDTSGQRAYVANIRSGSVSLVDVNHGELLSFEGSGAGAEGIALAPNGRDLWVTNRAENTLSLFDARYLRRDTVLNVAGFPVRAEMSSDGQFVLVTAAAAGALVVVNAAERRVEQTVDLGLQAAPGQAGMLAGQFGDSSLPVGIEVAPDGKRVWIAHAGANKVQELEVGSWRTIRLLEAGREPDGMGYSPLKLGAQD